jgi:hypothetical protein
MVTILAAEFVGTGWFVQATVEDDQGSRRGSYLLDLPEQASREDIERAILALYA